METHHLYHLAACWGNHLGKDKSVPPPSPLATGPVVPTASHPTAPPTPVALASPDSLIRVAAAQMVFASRTSQDFIAPERVTETEQWTGQVRPPIINHRPQS